MCGIAGIISPDKSSIVPQRLKQMSDTLAHRGPDGEGLWINRSGVAGFSHRRLAIIDLSPGGAQPMHYPSREDARYTIVYNGEIYNYVELRKVLQNKRYVFNTKSDTEVILAAYDCYKEKCVEYFDGMFAFAIWDEEEQQLFAARDRFGEKPFFYHYHNNALYFGSEVKALWAAGVQRTADEAMLLHYLASGNVQSPINKTQTFYKEIYSLPAAHFLLYNPASAAVTTTQYWTIEDKGTYTGSNPVEQFGDLLSLSVKRRLRSDVPIGTNLSGGLDSSSVIAAANELTGGTLSHKSFSVVFPGFDKDESPFISDVTKKFNLENFNITPSAADLITDFENLCYHQELPFDSASVYLQYALSRLAKQHDVKVLLDGQGADESLAGYTKYFHWYLQELLREAKWKTFSAEKKALTSNNVGLQWNYKNYLAALLPAQTAAFLRKKEIAQLKKTAELEDDFVNEYLDEAIFYKPPVYALNDVLRFNTLQSGLEELLRFADRNSMAFGRELRLPFLSHELVEFVFSLPANFKIRNGYSKWILRETMKEKLPASVAWRKDKTGFEPPQLQWMNNPLLQQLIYQSRQKLSAAGILKKSKVNIPIRPVTAFSAQNMDWRYLVAAQYLPG